MTASQREDRGGSSKRAVVSAWPLAFCATRQRHRKKKKVRDQRRYQGRRRGRRGTCCETVEDAASFPDLRLKSTMRSHRQHPAQKHTIRGHHVVSSCAVIHWSLGPSVSADARERERERAPPPGPHRVRNNLVLMCGFLVERKFVQCRRRPLASREAPRENAEGRHPWTPRTANSQKRRRRRTCRRSGRATTRGVRNLQLMDILTTAGRDSIVAVGREAGNHAPTGAATAKSVPAVRPVWYGSTGVHWKLGPWAHDTYEPETSPWSGLPRCGSWTVGLAWCVVPLDHGEVICLLPEPVRASGNPIVSNDHRHKHG